MANIMANIIRQLEMQIQRKYLRGKDAQSKDKVCMYEIWWSALLLLIWMRF